MKRISNILVVVFLSAIPVNALSQDMVQKYLSQLPGIPENTCRASSAAITKWSSGLYELKQEITILLADEKEAKEKARAEAQPRPQMFEPTNAERIRQISEAMQAVDIESNAIIENLTMSYIEQQGALEVKYAEVLDPLYEQQKASINSGKIPNLITDKINAVKEEKCREMSEVRKNHLKNYYARLAALIELGKKSNRLSDEFIGMTYSGYVFTTKYEYSLGFLLGYMEELSRAYDDVPLLNIERKNI